MDEIQLRFRDKYAQDLKEFNFQSNFNDFSGEFETTRALVEKKCKEIQDSKQMGTFKEVKNYAIRLGFIFLIIQSFLMDHAGINEFPRKFLLFPYCFQKISYFSISSFVKPWFCSSLLIWIYAHDGHLFIPGIMFLYLNSWDETTVFKLFS